MGVKMKRAFLFMILAVCLFPLQPSSAEDFIHNQQSSNNRFNASTCPKCQGYDPYASILNAANLNLFIHKGPGAVTDNMFGLVSGPDLGADNAAGGTGTAADTDTKFCGPTGNGGVNYPAGSLLGGNNCGNLRIDPTTQGQSIPGGNNTSTNLHEWVTFSGDFFPCATLPTLCNANPEPSDSHNGFQLTLDFNWSCVQAPGGPPPPPVCNTVTQRVKQVTLTMTAAEGGGAGQLTPETNAPCTPALAVTKGGEGPGDSIMLEDTCYNLNRSSDGSLNPSNPVIQWTEAVHEPVFFASGPNKYFEYSVSGFFYYNDPNLDLSNQPLGRYPQSSYPTGRSQTDRSNGVTPPDGSETIPTVIGTP